MENELKDILTLIVPPITLVIGWFLGRMSESSKRRHDDKRVLKRTLFVLLEIRHRFVRVQNLDRLLEKYLSDVQVKYGAPPFSEEQTKMFTNLLSNSIKASAEEETDLKLEFSKCIEKLPEVDPVFAFRLEGKQHIHTFLDSFETVLSDEVTELDKNQIDQIVDFFAPTLNDELELVLNDFLIELARMTSRDDLRYVKRMIQDKESDIDEFISDTLEKLFSGLFEPHDSDRM